MSTPEVIAAIGGACALGLAALLLLGHAKEWVAISLSVSVKFIPASKRQPRTAVELVNVVPGVVEQPAAAPISAARSVR